MGGVDVLDDETWNLLRLYIGRIAEGRVAPFDGLEAVISDIYIPRKLGSQQRKYAGDSHDLERLYALWDAYLTLGERPEEVSYDDLYGADALAALNRDVICAADEWLLGHRA